MCYAIYKKERTQMRWYYSGSHNLKHPPIGRALVSQV